MFQRVPKLAVFFACGSAFLLALPIAFAQNTTEKAPPVIDVHVHAMDESFPGMSATCPNESQFLASDPKTKEAPFGWSQEECTPKLLPQPKANTSKMSSPRWNALTSLRLSSVIPRACRSGKTQPRAESSPALLSMKA